MNDINTNSKNKVKVEGILKGFPFSNPPLEEDLYKCVHCGFCLQACPTYVQTGLETESPRGRIALMKGVIEGRLKMNDDVIDHWDMCIQCRACEDVCPSGVPYGNLIEKTMAQVNKSRKSSILAKGINWLLLRRILTDQVILSGLVGTMRIYQKVGLHKLISVLKILHLIPGNLGSLHDFMPRISDKFFSADGQTYHTFGEPKKTVGLLSGCIMPLINGPEMRAAIRVLTRNGVKVIVPKEQGCCGAIHSHVGDLVKARSMARRNIDAFLSSDIDAVLSSSAGCSTRMKEYSELLKDDSKYISKAKQLESKVKDMNEFLYELPIDPPKGRLESSVTYQDPCHLAHTQKIRSQPRELLKLIPGLNLIEMRNSDRCCGAGGTYVITQHQMSLKLMNDKMKAIEETGAQIVTTGNPGCWMQMNQGSQKTNMPVQVKYVTDLLDESYRAERIENEPETKSTPFNESAWEEERLELRSQWKNRAGDRRKRRDR
tara:strand:+ start:1053 stop:2516 length:1464 start_codon:yes stop_codon:yes gene_type:complete